jgi:hypothetical protein
MKIVCRLCKKELTDKERLYYTEEMLDQWEYLKRVICSACYTDISESIERRERERNGMILYSED